MEQATFTDRQPEYRYFPIGNGRATVFIYRLVNIIDRVSNELSNEEETVTWTDYIYDVNEFNCDSDLITEKDIKEDPIKYLTYLEESADPETQQLEFNLDIEYRLSMLELGL